ncbi:MAG: tetraacyldisaccharide 4'-kinase [Bacteroidota bacterium]
MTSKNILYYIFSVVRLLLYPLALIYGAVVWLRNRMYDSKFFSSIQFSVPVISVGNLSTGGTGKTPHIEYLIRLLEYQYTVATMSRGYKRHTQGFIIADDKSNALRIGDEPMQYHMKYPGLVVSVAEERITGIPTLLQRRPDIEVILLDDAYQHRSVRPGINILITDFSKPFYKDHILPFGSLRESRTAYKRADIILVSKCHAGLTEKDAEDIKRSIAPLPAQQVYFTYIQYDSTYDLFTGEAIDLVSKSILLVCGIARPEPLLDYLNSQAAHVHTLTYADHHYFVSSDLEEIRAAFDNWNKPDKIIVTTEKDAARLHLHAEKLRAWNIALVVVPITVKVLFNKSPELDAMLLKYVEQTVIENNEMFGGGSYEQEDNLLT